MVPVLSDRPRLIVSFMSRVRTSDKCWEYLGPKDDKGYGLVAVDGKTLKAHRVSFALFVGEIPDDQRVLHACDNRPCVRPDHLFLGTQLENIADRCRKGRSARGFRSPNAKLSDAERAEIKRLHASNSTMTYATLARMFGVNDSTISRTISGKWSYHDRKIVCPSAP